MLLHKYKRIVLAILLIITSLVSFLGINPNIVIAKAIIDSYEVAIAETDGNFTKIGSYETYSEAKSIMDKNENSVIRHNGSKSPMKIIAMREGEGIAISYPYRTGSSGINNSLVMLYPNSGLSNAYTYIPTYYDLEYFKTESTFNPSTGKASVQVRINGYKGYADLRHLDLIPYNFIKKHVDVQIGGKPYNGDTSNYPIRTTSAYQNYYKVSNGELFHYTRNYKSNKYYSSFVIGKAHKDMTDGDYYSFDGIHFFNDSELTDTVVDSNGNPIEHYNYFQYLPLRSKTNYSGTDFDNYLKSLGYTKLATSPYQSGATILHEKGNVFIRSQEKYGLNGLMVFSIANHESAYGRSAYAVSRYNLYGWNAIDSNPDKAKDFNSVDHCVTEMMGYNLQGYMSSKTTQYGENREDGRHFGTHIGNKQSGMNVKYASDPYWGEKISGHAYRADKYLKNKDYDYYTIGVTKTNSVYNVRKESNTSNTPISQLANATVGGIKNMPVLVLDEVKGQNVSGNDKWYQIMSNHPLDSKSVITYHEEDDRANAEVPYNYFTSNAYTHSGGIKILNGSLKHTWPGKLTKEQELKKLTTNIEQIEWREDKLYLKGYSYHEDLSLPYILYKGETWTSHNIIFVSESDNKRYEYKLSARNSKVLNTDSKVYDAAFFENEIDVSNLPYGKYNVYIKTITQGYTFEDNLLNSNGLSLPNSKKINTSKFVLENINKSKDLTMTVMNITSGPEEPEEPNIDFNNNNIIDTDDLKMIITNLGKEISLNDPNEKYDINYDSKIDLEDLNIAILKFDEYIENDILTCTADEGLHLRDKDNNWESLKLINKNKSIVVLDEKPIYYNGYLRLKVQTIEPNKSDEIIGWVAIDWVEKSENFDFNNDGVVDYRDIIEISKYINGSLPTEEDVNKFDVNNDGKIDLDDLDLVHSKLNRHNAGGSLNNNLELLGAVPQIKIVSDLVKVSENDIFKISIQGRNIKELYAANVNLKYNSELIEVIENEQGKPFNNSNSTFYNNGANSGFEYINRYNPNDSSIIQYGISLIGNESSINIKYDYEEIASVTFKLKSGVAVPVKDLFNINTDIVNEGDISVTLLNSDAEPLEYSSLNYEYEYDANKNLIAKYTFQNIDGRNIYKFKYCYGENGDLQYKLEYDENEKVIVKYTYYKDSDGNYYNQYKYGYKEDGSLNYKYVYKDGKIIANYIYVKDNEGKYQYKYKYVYKEDGTLNYKYVYKDGKIIANYIYTKDSNGKNIYKYKYAYKEDGTLNYKYVYDDGKIIANYIYTKDSNGKNIYKYKYVYKEDGTINYKYVYKDGKIIANYIYTKDSKGKYIYKYKYAYKEDGTLNYKYFYKDGKIIANYIYIKDSKGKYIYKYKYVYKEDGSLDYKYEYNNGELISKYIYIKDSDGKYQYKYKLIYDSDTKSYTKKYTYKDGKIIAVENY